MIHGLSLVIVKMWRYYRPESVNIYVLCFSARRQDKPNEQTFFMTISDWRFFSTSLKAFIFCLISLRKSCFAERRAISEIS